MDANQAAQPWAVRSALVAVTDLERSVEFYRGLGGGDVLVNEGGVAVLGGTSPEAFAVILREAQSSHATRYGQQSLGLRFLTLNVGSIAELDRVEPFLRDAGRFTSRRTIADGAAEVVLGRDPDNLPLVLVYYGRAELEADYLRAIADLVHSLDA